MKKFLTLSLVAVSAALVACSGAVPQDAIYANMSTSRQNAQKSADSFLPVL